MVVPNYKEFTVANLYQMFADDVDVLSYLPDEGVGSRPVDRTFAFTIVCSKHPNYM